MNARITELAHKALAGALLDHADGRVLAAVDGDDIYDLFYWANRIRIARAGRPITFCAIVAAKLGGCSEDCKFCAQSSRYPTAVGDQSRLTDEQILQSALHAAQVGADSFGIVNSGRAPTRAELEDWLAPVMARIASEGRTRACATLGALTPQTAKFLHDCGIRRINHNLETSRRFFPSVVGTHPYEERIRTLKTAKAAGLSLCSGGIFGLGETWDDRLDMLLELRDIGVDVVPINFLNPIAGTPYESQAKLPPMECLKIIAVARFLLCDKQLKVAGGREACLRDLQSWIFFAGASSTMIGNYLTTYGRKPEQDHQMVLDLGLQWHTYDGGPVNVQPPAPLVQHSGRHRIPILYERELVASPPATPAGHA